MAETTLFNQDCIVAMKKIDASSIDLIVTDIFIPSLIQSNISQKCPKPYSISGLGHFCVLGLAVPFVASIGIPALDYQKTSLI